MKWKVLFSRAMATLATGLTWIVLVFFPFPIILKLETGDGAHFALLALWVFLVSMGTWLIFWPRFKKFFDEIKKPHA